MVAADPARGQHFELLYQTAQAFNSSLDLAEVFRRVIAEVIEITRAERGFVILRQPDGSLHFSVAQDSDGNILTIPQQEISHTVIEEALKTGQTVLCQDAQCDGRFDAYNSVTNLQLKSILCVPLACKVQIEGVIYVENRVQKGVFTERDLELLAAIAANASTAIDNARNFQDLQDQLQTLNLLYEISSDLTSRLDLKQLLVATIQRVKEALAAPAASLLTVEGDELVFQVALGEKSNQIRPFRIPIDHGIAGWAIQHARGAIINDAQSDPRLYAAADAETGFVTQSVLVAPLLIKEQAIGVVELFNKPGGFTENDLELLGAIASTAAIAIENARLYQAAVEQGRMERELQMAVSVQTGLLPETVPQLPGWDFAAHWQPAREVSGDFYDFIRLDSANHMLFQNEPPYGIVIADVTDKGMPAALFMAFTRSIIRANLYQGASPAEGLTQANRLICEESSRGLFVTLFYGQLNPSTGDIRYINAGHNPPLYYRAATQTLERLMPTGIPIGIDEDFRYQQARVNLEPGDFILCYTDGVTEAINAAAQEFGIERLEQVAQAHQQASARQLLAAVEQAVLDFTGPGKQFDDTTIVVIRRNPG